MIHPKEGIAPSSGAGSQWAYVSTAGWHQKLPSVKAAQAAEKALREKFKEVPCTVNVWTQFKTHIYTQASQ